MDQNRIDALGALIAQSATTQPREQAAIDLDKLRALIADDGYAMTFQPLGQYRTAFLKSLDDTLRSERAEDGVVEANRKLLLDRSRVGLKKYGAPLANSSLSLSQVAQHALEEALDLANYLQTIILNGLATRQAAPEAPACKGCDPAEGFCCACRDAEQHGSSTGAAPEAPKKMYGTIGHTRIPGMSPIAQWDALPYAKHPPIAPEAPASEQQALKSDMHADYHYLLGLRAGWNLSQQQDVAGFNAALVSRQNSLDEARAELRATPAATTASASREIEAAAVDLLKYLDEHDWGGIPEGATASRLRNALAGRSAAPSRNAAPLDEQVVQALWAEAGREWVEGGRSQSLIFAQKVAALTQQSAAHAPSQAPSQEAAK